MSENRNKFNTLTLAEARMLNRSMSHTRPPIRTASVINKPRPPPLNVTNLDVFDSRQKLSDDSYVSARSDMSGVDMMLHSGYGTPSRQFSDLDGDAKRSSVSKLSLTSSTYKVLQSPFANIKRFFRTSIARQPGTTDNDIEQVDSPADESRNNDTLTNEDFKSSLRDSGSVFNRSQTPPVCPPPPGELKSMSYMSMNSREDIHKERRLSAILPRPPTQPPPPPPSISSTPDQPDKQQPQFMLYSDYSDKSDSWQLTSLPVYYERNLATVFEEQKVNNNYAGQSNGNHNFVSACHRNHFTDGHVAEQHPKKIDDCENHDHHMLHTMSVGSALTSINTRSSTSSCQSLSSITNIDSFLDSQRQKQERPPSCGQPQQAPVAPYRFSFAQPLSPPAPVKVPSVKNSGLPPRVPSTQFCQTLASRGSNKYGVDSRNYEASKHISDNNSSSGNSSNCSSQFNVVNNCDRFSSLENSERTSSYSDESPNVSANGMGGTGGNLNGLEHDLDTTVLSETSTLQGDASGAAFYMNKCAELERTVTALKNKLISKEKELTDLQLNQLNYDYTIDRLKSQVNKLEKENQQLKRRQLYAM